MSCNLPTHLLPPSCGYCLTPALSPVLMPGILCLHSLIRVRKVNLSNMYTHFFFFWCFETESQYVVQAGFELAILLPQSSKCWNYTMCHHTWFILHICEHKHILLETNSNIFTSIGSEVGFYKLI
jgi:hypothetical protein